MKKLNLLTAVAIGFSAATMLFLAKTEAAAPGPNDCQAGSTAQVCVVLVKPNNNVNAPPKITPNVASILKDDNQEVQWECDPDHPDCQFVVVFTDETEKPFENRVFTNSNPKTGPPIVDKDPNKRYKYSVIVNGRGSADPQIIVH